MSEATIISRAHGIIAGLQLVDLVMHHIDPSVSAKPYLTDGDTAKPGDILVQLHGPARSLSTGERTALNFLQRMSGIATLTSQFVAAVADFGVHVLDTRKTAPGNQPGPDRPPHGRETPDSSPAADAGSAPVPGLPAPLCGAVQPVPAEITVTIWHNVALDGQGRHTAMLDGYQPGDPVVRVFAYQADPGRAAEEAAEEAFAIFKRPPRGRSRGRAGRRLLRAQAAVAVLPRKSAVLQQVVLV